MMHDTPPIEPVHVTIVGGTGDGTTKQELVTSAGQPNVIATFVPTATALVVRFVDTFLTVLLTVTGVGAASNFEIIKQLLPNTASLGSLRGAIFYSAVAATIGLAKDLTVIVGKLKKKYPLLDV
jgi:hypothetical protein